MNGENESTGSLALTRKLYFLVIPQDVLQVSGKSDNDSHPPNCIVTCFWYLHRTVIKIHLRLSKTKKKG